MRICRFFDNHVSTICMYFFLIRIDSPNYLSLWDWGAKMIHSAQEHAGDGQPEAVAGSHGADHRSTRNGCRRHDGVFRAADQLAERAERRSSGRLAGLLSERQRCSWRLHQGSHYNPHADNSNIVLVSVVRVRNLLQGVYDMTLHFRFQC